AQLAGMICLARGVLAGLSGPLSGWPAAASAAAEPRYAGRRDPCKLIAPATLARYVPGATLSPIPNPSGPTSATSASTCSWGSDDTLVLLDLDFFSDAASAGQNFQDDAGSSGRGAHGVTVTGMQALNDLG